MRHTAPTILTASTVLLAAMVGMPSNAQSQTIIIIGNGSAQPYYPQPYAVKTGTRSLGQCQITAHRGNMDDRSVRAFALKPRAFGAPLGGVGA